jgi:ankyrin repeat protein
MNTHGADVNVANNSGETVLHTAAAQREEAGGGVFCGMFLRAGADCTRLNAEGLSALHVAAREGNEENCKLLVSGLLQVQ